MHRALRDPHLNLASFVLLWLVTAVDLQAHVDDVCRVSARLKIWQLARLITSKGPPVDLRVQHGPSFVPVRDAADDEGAGRWAAMIL
jgi:hypothetical protein